MKHSEFFVNSLAAPNKAENCTLEDIDYLERVAAGLNKPVTGVFIIATGGENRGTGPGGSYTFDEAVALGGDDGPGIVATDAAFYQVQIDNQMDSAANGANIRLQTAAPLIAKLRDKNINSAERGVYFFTAFMQSKDTVGDPKTAAQSAFEEQAVRMPAVHAALDSFFDAPPPVPPQFVKRVPEQGVNKGGLTHPQEGAFNPNAT